MSASQSGTFNVQQFTDLGAPLVGGRLYTYAYGTTTQKTAYTDHAGAIPHTYTSDGLGGQYIALNARGELPAPLYLAAGSYDLALKTSAGATVWTRRADPVWDITSDLSASTGSSLIGFIQSGTGAVARTVQDKAQESVSVLDFGAAPSASAAANYTAFAAATIYAASAGLGILIPAGSYNLSANWVISTQGMRITAQGKVILNFTNAGNCVSVDGGAAATYIFDVHFGEKSNPIWINGNASTTNALYWRAAHHGSASIKAWNCITAHRIEFAVGNDFYITASASERVSNILTPTYGIYCDQRAVGEDTADNIFWNPILEGILTGVGTGIRLEQTTTNKFISGTSEGNKIGVSAGNGAYRDNLNGLYCEVNGGGTDFEIGGTLITLTDCFSGSGAPTPTYFVRFVSGATDCRVIGGDFPAILIDAGAIRTQCIGTAHAVGTMITDNGTNSLIVQALAASKFSIGAKFGVGTTYALDFYDVGTFTATITCGTSGTVTLNPSFQTLGYVKIGRLVTITGILLVGSVSAPLGTCIVGTLPFATDSAQSSRASVSVRAGTLTAAATTAVQGRINASSSTISLETFAAGVAAGLSPALQASSEIYISATYIAAS